MSESGPACRDGEWSLKYSAVKFGDWGGGVGIWYGMARMMSVVSWPLMMGPGRGSKSTPTFCLVTGNAACVVAKIM